MFALVREAIYDPERLRHGQAQVEEMLALRDRQPGSAGGVSVAAGAGRVITLVLWESEAQAEAAQAVLESEAQRLMGPLRALPSRIFAQGPVLRTDLAKR